MASSCFSFNFSDSGMPSSPPHPARVPARRQATSAATSHHRPQSSPDRTIPHVLAGPPRPPSGSKVAGVLTVRLVAEPVEGPDGVHPAVGPVDVLGEESDGAVAEGEVRPGAVHAAVAGL